MKTEHAVSEIAFPDPKLQPTQESMIEMIGATTYASVARLDTWLQSAHPNLVRQWMFSTSSGWYQIPTLKDRRLYYLIPHHGDFRLNIVLGDRAIASLEAGPHAKRVTALLKHAKRYPEGTAFSFDSHAFDADLMIALVRAKLAH